MKCDKCNNQATVIFKQNINGKITQQYLCEKCANDINIDMDMKKFNDEFTNIFENMFNLNFGNYLTIDKPKIKKCDTCGNTYEDFIHKTKLSCENCYKTFNNELDNVIKKLQGSNKHIGKQYVQMGDNKAKEKEKEKEKKKEDKEITIDKLKEKLNLAIKEERYEDAAIIRDEIKKRGN
ncbi:MAG: hypothetical protein E7311_02330 [Clostridiales bacterium]|nr:hypothetical protein [Clostridiales bacterium]